MALTLNEILLGSGISSKNLNLAVDWITTQSQLPGQFGSTTIDSKNITLGQNSFSINGKWFDIPGLSPTFETYTSTGNPAGKVIQKSVVQLVQEEIELEKEAEKSSAAAAQSWSVQSSVADASKLGTSLNLSSLALVGVGALLLLKK